MPRWTEQELARLRRLVQSDLPVEQFNIRGRSPSACYSAMKSNGIRRKGKDAKDGRRVVWSKAEVTLLRTQAKNANSLDDFDISGKTSNAIDRKLRKLRIHPDVWTKAELALLKTQAKTACSLEDFSIGRKRPAVIKRKLQDLGLLPASRPWTAEEHKSLKLQVESGKKADEWFIEGRSKTAMIREASRQKYKRPSHRTTVARQKPTGELPKPWTDEEVALLRSQINAALAPSKISIPGRTTAAVHNKARRLGWIGDNVSRNPWTQEEKDLLRNLHAEGMSANDIAAAEEVLPGRSRSGIQKQIGRLGLADPERSARIKAVERFDHETLARFHAFLRRYAREATPEQLALAWNDQMTPAVSTGRVIYHLVQLRIKPSQHEVRQMHYSKAKQCRKSAKFISATKKRWREFRERQERVLDELARERRRQAKNGGPPVTERVCRNPRCRKRRPAESPFFYIKAKRLADGSTIVRFPGLCRMCENERRRKAKAKQG